MSVGPSHAITRRGMLLGSAVLFAGAVAAGCEPKAETVAAGAKGERLTYPATDYFEAGDAKPIDGGAIRLAASTDAGSLDLHSISHGNAQWLGRLIYDNLVYLDDKGQISPWLAKSWEVSPDGKTYTFHLRDDVTFSDGAKFDAEAVRVNLEHMRDPATKSPLAAAYIAPYVNGEAVDPLTFRAHLREPYTPFLNVLAQSWLSMESPKAIQERPKTLGDHPVGSGPYVVTSYVRQQTIRLERRKDYNWAPDFTRHKGPAHIDRIDIDVVPEAITRYTSLSSGQYALVFEAPLQNAAAIRSDPRLALDIRMRTGVATRAVTFNLDKPPFDDLRVRRAFVLASDREAIVKSVYFGELKPKGDYLSANTPYYDGAFSNQFPYDPATANRLLDEAGWTGRDAQGYRTKDGQRLGAEVLTQDTGVTIPLVVAVQSDLRKVGFDLKIVQAPIAELTQRRNAGDYQMLGGGVWHTNTPDALYIVFDSNEITSAKRVGQNTAHLRDEELDKVLAEARGSSDPAQLKQLYSRAQQRLIELVPALPTTENNSIVAYRKELRGVTYDTSHNTPIFTGAWIEKA